MEELGDAKRLHPAVKSRETSEIPPVSDIKDKRLLSILQNNSSKVVDANGEPIVNDEIRYSIDNKISRIEKLRNSEPIIASGEEYKGLYELNNRSANKYIINNLRGNYINADTGNAIIISRKGADKVTRHDAESDPHLKSVALIPQMIEKAIFITEENNDKLKNGFESYRYYVVGLKLGDVDYTAKLAVGVKNNETYYDHALTEIEKSNLIKGIDLIKRRFADNEVASSDIKDKRLISILQNNSSKVIDANGEPIVNDEIRYSIDNKISRIEKLRNSAPVEITGSEIEPSSDLKQYKRNAMEYGKALRGKYVNTDTGETVILSGGSKSGGLREILHHDYKDIEHLQSIAAIPQIIEKSVLITEEVNEDPLRHPKIDRYKYYVCGLRINGIDYTVKAIIAVDTLGNNYYDHKLTQIEKGALISGLPVIQKMGADTNTPNSGFTPKVDSIESDPSYTQYKDKRLISILQNNSSKVVDANGEPIVNDEIRYRELAKDIEIVTCPPNSFKNVGEAKNWAKENIVRTYSNKETGGKGDIRISNKAVDKYLSGSSINGNESKDTHLSVLQVLPQVIKESVDAEQHKDYTKDKFGRRSPENGFNENVTIHRLYGAANVGEDIYRVKITLKEDTRNDELPHNAYSYEATKIELLSGTLDKSNKLDDAPKPNNSISVTNLLNGVEKSYEKGKYLLNNYSTDTDTNGEPIIDDEIRYRQEAINTCPDGWI